MKIVLLGHVCIDTNSTEHTSYTSWGSSLMYMAEYYQGQGGADPTLVAPYGEDFLRYGEGFDLLPGPAAGPTLTYMNHTTGQHREWRCGNTEFAEPVALSPEIIRVLSEADIICVAPLLPNFSASYIAAALSHRRAGSIAVLQVQGYLRTVDPSGLVKPSDFTDAGDILPYFDMALLSEDDSADALGAARQWAGMSPSTHVIVTLGPGGAALVSAAGQTDVPTSAVADEDILDSVGCGDTFAAAGAIEYYRSHDVMAAIRAGNAAARDKLFRTAGTK